jgi:hypothetical protein
MEFLLSSMGITEAMGRQVLKSREKVLGPEHPDTLTSINNLAIVLRIQGKYEEAEVVGRRALKSPNNLEIEYFSQVV